MSKHQIEKEKAVSLDPLQLQAGVHLQVHMYNIVCVFMLSAVKTYTPTPFISLLPPIS